MVVDYWRLVRRKDSDSQPIFWLPTGRHPPRVVLVLALGYSPAARYRTRGAWLFAAHPLRNEGSAISSCRRLSQ